MNIFTAGRLECNTIYIVVITPWKDRLISFPEKVFGLRSKVSKEKSPFFDS